MIKVNAKNWAQLDFLINNFYEIVEYKRGRGVYGDRVILKRSKKAEAIFGEPDRLYEFFYLDANAVKELPRTIFEKINIICRLVISPESMNVLCNFEDSNGLTPIDWATDTKRELSALGTLDFEILNEKLIERYKLLNANFLSKLKRHREKQYFLASSEEFSFIPKEYANEQLSRI